MWCYFSCFQGDCWSFPAAGPSGGDACTLPGIEFHSPKHSLLFVPYAWHPPARALTCYFITASQTKARRSSSFKRLYLLPRRIPHKGREFNLACFGIVFFFFNQVVLPQTSTARAESEFLPIVSFSPLKNNCLMHDFNKNRIWLCQRNDGRL